jgi:hypothetical protein
MFIRVLFFAAALICGGGVAFAETVNLPRANPVVAITFPQDWGVSRIPRGIEVKSPDEEVFVWFETFPAAAEKRVWSEHEAYFNRQGVTISGDPTIRTNADGGVSVRFIEFNAKWQGAPTVLRYLVFDLNLASKTQLMMSYWASPAGDKVHAEAMKAIIESLKSLP